ncbi:MAG: serine O-acetyltransferase [Flavobacteriales bacterium]|jgi:serine O-acetyltransferase|uniref:serine O-acetyltransferase n=1 Tax=Blattabacterium sp. (Mastotermes darwiniensis) TaxID=39768 RepID=UPI000231DE4C|nr:serine O-acetyltransferase [Blattabacterium sp. (Mastotermes darwiniensis)]AER40640.1 putative serine O-acetyltransferase [Blattabacterium sp. (Mastotermes darwiniensis) str. MADAR]MDR1804832.1 serine O-acetyltransferase [Flavobacteriales bacterium]
MSNKDFLKRLFEDNKRKWKNPFPNKNTSEKFVEELFHLLFTPDQGLLEKIDSLKVNYKKLQQKLYCILLDFNLEKRESKKFVENFFDKIPNIYQTLIMDANAILDFDPAATVIEEIFLSYPGFFATALYRIAHQLWVLKIPILPRLITEYAHSKTGVDIHASAEIGKYFAIDHGTGIVIGSSTKIGNRVKIYQGVTLGAIYVDKKLRDQKRHPTIEDQVTIYAGATILGGDTVVGHDSILGGNVWITHSIPPFSIVSQTSEIKIRNNSSSQKKKITI